MKTIIGQILAGTQLDKQGERNTREVLEAYANSFKGRRQPLHQQHDLSLPVIGYIENFRVTPDDANAGEWHLVGDVYIENGSTPLLGGFSVSYIEKLRFSRAREHLEIYLPFPHYNDQLLLNELFEEGNTSVGRIIRKGASPEEIALIVSIVVAVLQPGWEEIYRSKIAPAVFNFFQGRFRKLTGRKISADLLQYVDYSGGKVQVLYIPTRGEESDCLSVEKQYQALLMVADYLNALDVNHVSASKLILTFDRSKGKFIINAVHFSDGTVRSGG